LTLPTVKRFSPLPRIFRTTRKVLRPSPFPIFFPVTLQAIVIANTLEGEAPLSVSFDGTASTGTIVKYEWMFGDGSAGFGSTIDHTFASAGSYAVTLKVTDDQGATDQETVTVTVTGPPMADTPPAAVISSSATVGSVPLQVHFDGSSSSDSDGSIVSHQWDLGDGATAAGAQVTHTYSTAGTFTAKLTVTDDDGLTGSTTTPVLVSLPSEETNAAPEAVISTSSNQGLIPLSVAFDASGSHDPDGEIITYTWNFGDGTTGSGISAAHLYTQAAVYTVTLEVTDNRGLQAG
jgi:PKD repeat protein